MRLKSTQCNSRLPLQEKYDHSDMKLKLTTIDAAYLLFEESGQTNERQINEVFP